MCAAAAAALYLLMDDELVEALKLAERDRYADALSVTAALIACRHLTLRSSSRRFNARAFFANRYTAEVEHDEYGADRSEGAGEDIRRYCRRG